MQLLPLLLPALLVLAVLAQDASSPRPRGRGHRRGKTITDETKAKMGRNLGLNMEERRARLEKFNRAPKLTDEQKAKLKERLAKHKKIEIEETEETAPQDPAEVNARSGIAPFFYESDINLTNEQLSAMEKTLNPDLTRSKRQASTYYKKWAANTVNYYYDTSISARKINVTEQALAYIKSRTCVNFVQNSTATNRIKVINGAGCYSSIGMIGGEQTLSLGDGCEVIGTPAHEFTHALGFFHMQSRSDRDTYVNVDTTYVNPSSVGNFQKVSAQENAIFTPFEYGSMMEYGANFMTNPSDKLSLVPTDMDFEFTMGNRQISHYDMMMINARYGCNQCDTASNRATCQNGGYPNPNNCAVCVCPQGYGGTVCDQRPAGCGSTLSATTTAQSLTVTMGDNAIITDTFDYCIYHITAPTGYYVSVKIVSVSVNSQCQYGCGWNGIEIKGNQGLDQKMTHPRFCCAADVNDVVVSYLNPTPFIVYNRAFKNTWTIQYTAVPTSSAPAVPVAITVPPTTLPPVFRDCHDTNSACASWKTNGWCTNYSLRPWVEIKYNCAVTCGWCGYQLNPCTDRLTTCAAYKAAGNCGKDDPMLAEYNCANTCGFCAYPN